MAKILVVDDSALSRQMSGRILREAGHEIVEAHDGIAAIEAYFLEKPSVVFLDINMKGMSGFEVLTKLRELDPHARVIIATADIQSSTRTMAAERGALSLVTKPFVAADVARAVEAALTGGAHGPD
jgi:two-component system, chemotaxis family, chemotaxis protein CheY